jgi:hypothetical protein
MEQCLSYKTLDKGKAEDPSHGAPMSTMEVIKSPGVLKVLFIYVMAAVLGIGFTAGQFIELHAIKTDDTSCTGILVHFR